MKVPSVLKKIVEFLSHKEDDPIEAAKRLVSFIQRLVGIHNMFGDKDHGECPYKVLGKEIYFLLTDPTDVVLSYIQKSQEKEL